MMIDYESAKAAFEKYVAQYDLSDNKIRLKWIHTYGVVAYAQRIAEDEKLGEEDIQLAKLIALLHDIGRFEQIRQFNSFSDNNVSHAKLAIDYLFKEEHIRDFIEDHQYDEIIKKAVEQHSLYKIEEQGNKRENLHIKLLRDADKLDNFRVKNTEDIETMFDISMEELAQQKITDRIYDQILCNQPIVAEERKTNIDMWASWIAFIFDLNFRSSFKCLIEMDYISKNIDRIDYQLDYTKKKMELIKKHCNRYIVWRSVTK